MPEAVELSLPRQDFSTRHPDVARLDGAKAPKTLGIALGTADLRDYPAIFQTALSVVHEYSDSPLDNIVLFGDALIDPDAGNMIPGYIPNFLEGAVDSRIESFKRDGVRVNWVGGENLFTGSARRVIERTHEITSPDPQLELFVVLDPSRLEVKPDVLLVSSKTSQETQEALTGPGTMVTTVGESITDVNGRMIDKALIRYARKPRLHSSSSA